MARNRATNDLIWIVLCLAVLLIVGGIGVVTAR